MRRPQYNHLRIKNTIVLLRNANATKLVLKKDESLAYLRTLSSKSLSTSASSALKRVPRSS